MSKAQLTEVKPSSFVLIKTEDDQLNLIQNVKFTITWIPIEMSGFHPLKLAKKW